MKSRLLIIVGIVVIGVTVFPTTAYASCDKQVGHADESCTPAELLEICDTLWSPRYDGSATPGNIFCRVVYDLDLNEDDVRKLGIHMDWENYAIQSSKDFVDDWGFYQDHAVPDTLLIYPSISMRDSLPPTMKVQISFDWIDESEIKIFDESLMIYMKHNREIIPLPENTWVIMPQEEPEPYSDPDNLCSPGQVFDWDICVDECPNGQLDRNGLCRAFSFVEMTTDVGTFSFIPIYIVIGISIILIISYKYWRKRK